VVYSREERLKVGYLQAQGRLPLNYGTRGPLGLAGARHAVAVVGCAVASVIVADAAVGLGWRYTCA
jgi:hypothetical protein